MSATEERDSGAERAGFRQALFREVNERIFELAQKNETADDG
jgi:hypothetical protein